MRSFAKISSVMSATAMTALLGALTLPANAMAIELSNSSPSYGDKVSVIHNDFGKDVIVRSNISIDELEQMSKMIDQQSRQIEELKRSGSGSGSSNREVDDLKNKVAAQERDLNNLQRQIDDLKRSTGSSSSSSTSELSSLKQQISNQDREMDSLRRTVEELSRKVK
ncbi:hypothetical protein [Pseudomonas sp. NPDC089569]|uniref:hypothetical protein n=1 Tax=Pseudomonas sp. NPDC089569 TaxID=3390722 RepID=UPI003CFE197F